MCAVGRWSRHAACGGPTSRRCGCGHRAGQPRLERAGRRWCAAWSGPRCADRSKMGPDVVGGLREVHTFCGQSTVTARLRSARKAPDGSAVSGPAGSRTAAREDDCMGKNMAVRRLDLGYFIRPASEVGGPQPRVEPVLAYLVQHDSGLILFDTGIGDADAETEAHYRPRRRALPDALSASGVALDDVSMIVNCHLHFDHIGGNPLLGGKPILVQDVELAIARRGGYTIDELIDFPGATYEGTRRRNRGLARNLDRSDTRAHPRAPVAGPPARRRHSSPRRPGIRLRFPLRVRATGPPCDASRRGTAASSLSALAGSTRRLRPTTCALRPRLLGLGTAADRRPLKPVRGQGEGLLIAGPVMGF